MVDAYTVRIFDCCGERERDTRAGLSFKEALKVFRDKFYAERNNPRSVVELSNDSEIDDGNRTGLTMAEEERVEDARMGGDWE